VLLNRGLTTQDRSPCVTMYSAGALGATYGAAIGLSATLAANFSRLGHHRAASAQPISREANRLRRRMPVNSRKIKAAESPYIALTLRATNKGQEIIFLSPKQAPVTSLKTPMPALAIPLVEPHAACAVLFLWNQHLETCVPAELRAVVSL
jgi:hypothetical protein